MGREAQAPVTYRGTTVSAKLLLEGGQLILRGGHQAKLPRSAIAGVRALAVETPSKAKS